MFFREENSIDLGETAIDNIFLDYFMPMAHGTYVKVFLLAYRYSLNLAFDNKNNQDLSKVLNVPISDILEAWDFWEKIGIIKKHRNSEALDWDFSIEFLNLKKLFIEKSGIGIKRDESISSIGLIEKSREREHKDMFLQIEKLRGSDLNYNEKRYVLEFKERYKLPWDLVVEGFSYSIEKNKKRSIKSVESLLKAWDSAGIKTIDDLKSFLEQRDEKYQNYRTILRYMGEFRSPSEPEKNLIDSWFNDLNLSMEVIQEAINRTLSTKTPSLKYVDAILRNWTKPKENQEEKKPQTKNFLHEVLLRLKVPKASLSSSELDTIQKLQSTLGEDVVLKAMDYCLKKHNKCSLIEVESLLKGRSYPLKKKTVTLSTLENVINKEDPTQKIFKSLGIQRPSEAERELASAWLKEYDMSVIDCALKITPGRKNAGMNYYDAILKRWKEEGLTSPDKIELNKSTKPKTFKANNQTSRFENLNKITDEYSPEELEELLLEQDFDENEE